MSSLVEEMLEETESSSVLFMEYVNFVPRNSKTILCFFEGYDAKYYDIRIRSQYNDSTLVNKPCGNKVKLLDFFDEISTSACRKKGVLEFFFVDRDFDDNSTVDSEIFVTDKYSIENYFLSDSAIKRVLINEFHFDEMSASNLVELNQVMNDFKNDRTQFIKDITDLNIWYRYQKEISRETGLYIDLSGIKSCKRMQFPVTLESCKNNTNGYVDISIDDYNRIKNDFMGKELSLFRGKYLGEFLHKKLSNLTASANSAQYPFTTKKSVKLNIGITTFIGVLSQYADTPTNLLKYIKNKPVNR